MDILSACGRIDKDNEFLQMSLFNEQNEKQRELDKAIDSIGKKHGSLAVHRASFLHSGGGTGEEVEYPVMSSLL